MVVPWAHVVPIPGTVGLGKTGIKEAKVAQFETGFCSASEESWHAQKKGVHRELAQHFKVPHYLSCPYGNLSLEAGLLLPGTA